MGGYIVQRKCRILDKISLPGDEIPIEAVPPDLENRLVERGYLAKNGVAAQAAGAEVEVPISTKEGILMLKMTPADIVDAIRIRQANAEDAAKAVAFVASEETLILINALDDRKTVKTAAHAEAARRGGKEKEAAGDA